MRISDWSSDVCSSDLHRLVPLPRNGESYAGQSEAKRHCRHGIWRNLSQTDAAPRAARETVFRHIHWETPVSSVGTPNFPRTVTPATESCPSTTGGAVPLGRSTSTRPTYQHSPKRSPPPHPHPRSH